MMEERDWLAALPFVYPDIPIQRCWVHKMRNIIDKVQKSVKEGLVRIYSRQYSRSTFLC